MVSRKLDCSHTGVRARTLADPRYLETALLVVTVCVLLFVAGMWMRNALASDAPLMKVEITVGRGDTLWSIAQEYGDPDQYILERVDALAKANNLKRGAVLREGQTLVIPVTSRNAKLYCGGTYASRQIAD